MKATTAVTCAPPSTEIASSSPRSAAPSVTMTHSANSAHRIRICYQDEAVRARSRMNAQRLMISATSPTSASTSNAALMAKKALKYRKVLERIGDQDVSDPEFDVWGLLGVDWLKQPSLAPHALRQRH